ncbi:glycerophosphodiester phosphodiesterase [Alkalibacterium kapii]|uniref:Glycerophosphoryl diester phosphodiesterase n=1 Tax=Alkalibacterium kapii TaxID=426704 RepID=A0A511AU27_9LACT|nr:glycerophosphodiester phosphodiesterase [Alkalibacterium kapii]GEK91689.1 glycerophosphoryl diester phosphodiesterase [Alkalibacterium kapii]
MKKFLKYLGISVLVILSGWLILFLLPLPTNSKYAYFEEKERPLVIAHRGGRALAPENTMAAFKNASQLGVDVLEYDVHLTADGHLVVIHDETVDRTTNGSGRINDMTLEEVKALDAGYHFQDKKGNYSFRGSDVKIPTVKEVFREFKNEKHLIELKDTNDPELHEKLIKKMWNLIDEFQMKDNVLIASFDDTINQRFEEISNKDVPVGAGEEETRRFVMMHKAFLNGIYKPKATAFQLPTEQEDYDLADWKLIRGANKRNMHVYYWTINNEKTMKKLIDLGANGIITDNPRLLLKVISKYES